MTGEEMERAIEFLLGHHAKVSADIDRLVETVSRLETQAELDREETRETVNNLMLANEVTRSLSENVAQLAIATSQRVTKLEEKLQ
jgi:hypothetical protein